MKMIELTREQKTIGKFIQLLMVITAIFILAACTEVDTLSIDSPKSIFAASANEVVIGDLIEFTNDSEGADTYSWDFGDGNNSEKFEPTHRYTEAGSYSVSLTVTNERGNHIATTRIDVSEDPNLANEADTVYTIAPDGYLTTLRFENIEVGSPIVYGQSSTQNTVSMYTPKGAEFDKPLVLLAPGGAWSSYTREAELIELCMQLATRGYAVGLLHYSILSAGHSAGIDIQVKSAIDQRNAIRFFKTNAAEYKIDPDNIFIGGWSSGAILSLGNAVMQDNEVNMIKNEALKVGFGDAFEKYQGHNLYTDQNYDVRGALVMFGWFYDLDLIGNEDTPLMLVNHKDAVMGDGTSVWGTFTSGGIELYGFDEIKNRALDVGYIEGEDLEYIKMDEYITMSNYASVESMSLINMDRISSFFFNNLYK